jgi:hypothetical protein
MYPHPVVEHFDVVEEFIPCFLSSTEAFGGMSSFFKTAKKLSVTALSQQFARRLMLCEQSHAASFSRKAALAN